MKSLITKSYLFFTFISIAYNFTGQELTLSTNLCNQTIQSAGTNINTNVNRGIGHRYEVSRLDGTVIGVYDAVAASSQFPSRSRFLFRFSFLTGFPWSFNSTYRIRVASFNGSSWSHYGPYCQVSTPSSELRISENFCNTQINNTGVNILTNSNHMAGHRFEVRELTGELVGVYDGFEASQQFPGRSPYIFRFSWMTSSLIAEGRTYSIRVSSFDAISGIWTPFGPSCNIRTPGLIDTYLTEEFCNNLLLDSNDVRISANHVPDATEYLFRIQDNNSIVGDLNSNSPIIDLKSLGGLHPIAGKTYSVSVATRRFDNLGFSDFGPSCNVAVMGFKTKLNIDYCGKVYNYLLEDSLFAEPIENAQAYKFRIKSGDFESIDTLSNENSTGFINLIMFPGIEYCRDYEISVAVKVNGVWGLFGEPCVITTVCHPITTLRPAFCNDTIFSCMTNLFSRNIFNSEGVQFEVTGEGFTEIVNASAHTRFRFTDLSNLNRIKYESSYSVRCRILMNGVWGQWGEPCSVYLKTNTFITNVCNQTVSSMSSNVTASTVGCAQDYRFLLDGPGVNNLVVNHPNFNNFFRFNHVPGVQMGATYSVRVSVLSNGQWSPYGLACNVSTPMPTKLSTIQDSEYEFSVYPNPSNTSFKVALDKEINGEYEIFNFNGQIVEKENFNGSEISVGDNLIEGIYFLIIKKEGEIILNERIVKIN